MRIANPYSKSCLITNPPQRVLQIIISPNRAKIVFLHRKTYNKNLYETASNYTCS